MFFVRIPHTACIISKKDLFSLKTKCVFDELVAYFQWKIFSYETVMQPSFTFLNGRCFLVFHTTVSQCPHPAVLHLYSLASQRLNVPSVLNSFYFRSLLLKIMGMVTILSEISFSWGSLKTFVVWFLQFCIRNSKSLFHLYFYFTNFLQKEKIQRVFLKSRLF